MGSHRSLLRALLPLALTVAGTASEALTIDDIAGRWETAAPVYDEASRVFGSYVFEFHGHRWTVLFTASADAAGQQRLFSLRVGPSTYNLGKPVQGMANAVEGDFERGSLHLTAHAGALAAMFNNSGCGQGEWQIGVEREVTATGCAFVASRSSCPMEHDIVAFDGRTLSLGDRSRSLCSLPRPTALSRATLVRKSVHAMIQARIQDPAEFFGRYVPGHVPSVQQYGGKFTQTLRALQPVVDSKLQGTLPGQMFIVQEWPSILAFNAWWNSPEYAPWSALRARTAEVQVTLASVVGK